MTDRLPSSVPAATGLATAPADREPDVSGFYLRDPYGEWRDGEGVPVVAGFGVDCTTVELGAWARLGGSGAYVDVAGRGDYCDVYVAEIAAGGHLEPEQHVFEKTIYVLSGRGTTTIQLADGGEHIVEWGRGASLRSR